MIICELKEPLTQLPDGIHLGYVANEQANARLCLFRTQAQVACQVQTIGGIFTLNRTANFIYSPGDNASPWSASKLTPIRTYHRKNFHELVGRDVLFDVQNQNVAELTSKTATFTPFFHSSTMRKTKARILDVFMPSPILALYRESGVRVSNLRREHRAGIATCHRIARKPHHAGPNFADLLLSVCNQRGDLDPWLVSCVDSTMTKKQWEKWTHLWSEQSSAMNTLHLATAFHVLYEACRRDEIISRVMASTYVQADRMITASTNQSSHYIYESFLRTMWSMGWTECLCHF